LFVFQAEDGIRDFHVTGVQTCALPIYLGGAMPQAVHRPTLYEVQISLAIMVFKPLALSMDKHELGALGNFHQRVYARPIKVHSRSEERRVGKGCSCRRAEDGRR